MASDSITTTISNDPFATPAAAEGICAIIVHATTVSTTFVIGTPYMLTKASDVDTLGVTSANNYAAYKQITEFYLQAGDGATLWVLPVADTTAYKDYLATEPAKAFVRQSYFADPLNGIKLLGTCYKKPTAGQTSTDFPADVLDSVPIFQTMIEALRNEGYFITGVVDGSNMDSSITAGQMSTLGTLTTINKPSIAVCIDSTTDDRVASVGQFLGKLSRISVGTDPGKVLDGSIYGSDRYLTSQVATEDLTPTDITALGNKQYVFARKRNGYSGWFYNDGGTCTATTNSLCNVTRNRIANYFGYAAYNYFTSQLRSNLPVDNKGDLSKLYCDATSGDYKKKFIDPLVSVTDISNGALLVSGVNYVSTASLTYKLEILPAPALQNVAGSIIYVQTLTL